MTDVYTQENGSKKKFLAPVLVILLCMVSLTAAGYAYSATIDNTGDHGDITGVTMTINTLPDTGIMYEIDGIDVYTHTTNGYAIFYNGTIGGIVKPGFQGDGTAVAGYNGSFTGFDEGYYVEVVKDGANVGYHAAPTDVTKENVMAKFYTDDTLNPGIFKYTTDYTLTVCNHSGGAICVKADAKWDAATELDGAIKAIYLVVKNSTGTVTGLFQVDNAATMVDVTGSIADGADDQAYTVSAYIILSDYLSDDGAVDFDPAYFSLSFETAVYAAP